jgi:peptidoglycan-associated lipoprotein
VAHTFPVLVAVSLLCLAGCKKKPGPTPEPEIVLEPELPLQPVSDLVPEGIEYAVSRMVGNFQRLYFEFDSHTLSEEGHRALSENVAIMQANPGIKLQLQGHADERGSTDYNLALGQQRATVVRSYLEASGISPSRLTVMSYGEEAPLVGGSSEQAWSQNRRCEFVITWGASESVRGSDR